MSDVFLINQAGTGDIAMWKLCPVNRESARYMTQINRIPWSTLR